ncbi:MAG: fused MFS/spermidine synthase [Methylococcales bacterium]
MPHTISEPDPQPGKVIAILSLFFFSGLLALVYEVFWMEELGLLFGNTAFAAATTLAAFFSGLAIGGYFWGQRAAGLHNPLQTYGLLELAVALSVFGYFQILDAYHALYPSLFEVFGNSRFSFVAVKFLLSMTLLFPAAFFIGGTLPVMTQSLVHDPEWLGLKVSGLYAVNTLGAATGSLLAGFYLPPLFGFSWSYGLAITATAVIGGVALVLARRWPASAVPAVPKPRIHTGEPVIPLSTIRVLALVSGFGTLGLQVLWTRMFAQVLQNSVYTFATILFIFLLALSAGVALANRMMKRHVNPFKTVFGLFTLGALLVAATPFVFNAWTAGLNYIGAQEGWCGYLIQVLKMEVAVMALPVLVLGAIFPFLLKVAEPCATSPGGLVGHLVALNTAGSIIGSLTAGFVMIEAVGTWAGIRLVGVIYLLTALYLLSIQKSENRVMIAIPMLGILLLVSLLDTSRLPQVRIDSVDEEESLLQVWESSSGTVAVVRHRDSLKIKVNNHYTLGGTGSRKLEQLEGYLPVLLHRKPESVFVLGLGTGISAGAVLDLPVQRLVVAELIPEVVEASKKYFTRFNNRLFFDSRVQVIEEDGRNVLAGSLEKFDLIITDLFIPWQSGAGSLYSLEHYRTVRERLRNQGLFMQWLPAYQLSRAEFGTIVRTLLEVFPEVTLWRGDFSSRKPVLGLLAQPEQWPLAADALIFSDQRCSDFNEGVPVLAHYIANIGVQGDEWMTYPINSDDKPVIEYQAPITQRRQKNQEVDWMTGEGLIRLMERIQTLQPALNDPYLKNLSPALRALPRAGMALHRSRVLKQQGRLSAAKEADARYKGLLRGVPEAFR